MQCWQEFSERQGGVLVIGHGTRKQRGTEQLNLLTESIALLLPEVPVAGCFLELADPMIDEGVLELYSRGCRQIVPIPVLLFRAGHAVVDIPTALRTACKSLPVRIRRSSAPLELSQAVRELSSLRFNQALHRSDPSRHGKIGLVMVGRGSSYRTAIEKMRRLANLRARASNVDWSEVCFFTGSPPSIEETMESAVQAGCTTIVIQPHLLFEGLLMDELREIHRQLREKYVAIDWHLAECLGTESPTPDNPRGLPHNLAKSFVQLATEALTSSFPRTLGKRLAALVQ